MSWSVQSLHVKRSKHKNYFRLFSKAVKRKTFLRPDTLCSLTYASFWWWNVFNAHMIVSVGLNLVTAVMERKSNWFSVTLNFDPRIGFLGFWWFQKGYILIHSKKRKKTIFYDDTNILVTVILRCPMNHTSARLWSNKCNKNSKLWCKIYYIYQKCTEIM